MDTPEFRIYKDAADEWRWSLVAKNGETIADSAEGYTTKAGAVGAAHRTVTTAGDAYITYEGDEDGGLIKN